MADTLRLGYFGDGPWAHKALERLLSDDSVDVRFVVPRFDLRDPVLVRLAEEAGVPVVFAADVNAPDEIARFATFGADLLVSMSFNQIIRPALFDSVPLGFINCHAGALPRYRGRNILNWVLLNDEPSFGITVHYVDEGIDTGDVILQRTYPLTDQDDYGTLVARAYVACADLLCEAIDRIASGTADRTPQPPFPAGFYCGRRGEGDEWLDWNQPSRDIFNFVRALAAPAVGARTFSDGRCYPIERVRLIDGLQPYRSTPGKVVGRHEQGPIVKTADTAVIVEAVRAAGGTAAPRWRIGRRFDTLTEVRIAHALGRLPSGI